MLAESEVHEPVNLGNPTEMTLLEMAELISELTDSRSEIVFEALPVDDPQVRRPDTTRASQLLGWEAEIDVREGLRRTIAHYTQILGEVPRSEHPAAAAGRTPPSDATRPPSLPRSPRSPCLVAVATEPASEGHASSTARTVGNSFAGRDFNEVPTRRRISPCAATASRSRAPHGWSPPTTFAPTRLRRPVGPRPGSSAGVFRDTGFGPLAVERRTPYLVRRSTTSPGALEPSQVHELEGPGDVDAARRSQFARGGRQAPRLAGLQLRSLCRGSWRSRWGG